MKKKVFSYIGFAKKSGNLAAGAGTCTLPAVARKIKLILIAADTAEGTIDKISGFAKKENIKFRVYGHAEELSQACGMPVRNIFGITDAGLADAIIKEIDSEKEV